MSSQTRRAAQKGLLIASILECLSVSLAQCLALARSELERHLGTY